MALSHPYPAARAAPRRWAESAERSVPALIALAVFAVAIFSPTTLNDGDSWWHVAAGDWILAHDEIPHQDIFSFTMAGTPWTAHEWLSEIALALAYRGLGWSGVALLTGGCAAAAAFLMTSRIARFLDGPALLLVALLGVSLMAPGLLARPHILALPVLTAWSIGILRARDEGRAPSWRLLPMMTLWANLHGGFAFGLALVGPFALEALIAARPAGRWHVVKGWGVFGLLAAGAALLTPHGIEGLLFPIKLLGMKGLAAIGEWRPSDFTRLGVLELALLATLGLALTRPVRIAPLRLALLLGFLHMALGHARHKLILGVMAQLLMAEPIARALSPGVSSSSAEAKIKETAPRAALIGLSALALVLAGARATVPVSRVDGISSPISALEAVAPALRRQPVLNSYDFGGFLIFKGLKPYIDGRTDMYGDAAMAEYGRITAPQPAALEDALTRHGIAWTIFNPGEPVVALLDAEPGWHRLYQDDVAVVHVKDGQAKDASPR